MNKIPVKIILLEAIWLAFWPSAGACGCSHIGQTTAPSPALHPQKATQKSVYYDRRATNHYTKHCYYVLLATRYLRALATYAYNSNSYYRTRYCHCTDDSIVAHAGPKSGSINLATVSASRTHEQWRWGVIDIREVVLCHWWFISMHY